MSSLGGMVGGASSGGGGGRWGESEGSSSSSSSSCELRSSGGEGLDGRDEGADLRREGGGADWSVEGLVFGRGGLNAGGLRLVMVFLREGGMVEGVVRPG